MSRIINPPRYDYYFKGYAPCNYSLSSRTNYRTLARAEDYFSNYQIEAFYKYDYGNFKIDWGLRSFEFNEDSRIFNLVLFTDIGIYKEDITRSIYDDRIFMRWTTFVTKLEERKPHLFITTDNDTRKIVWFYPDQIIELIDDETKVTIVDTEGRNHVMNKTDKLLKAFKDPNADYVDIDETNLIPVYWFHMWYTMF